MAIATTTACPPRYVREVEDAPARIETRYPDLPVAYAAMTMPSA